MYDNSKIMGLIERISYFWPKEKALRVSGFNEPISVGSLPVRDRMPSKRYPDTLHVTLDFGDHRNDAVEIEGVPLEWGQRKWFEVFMATETRARQYVRAMNEIKIAIANTNWYANHNTLITPIPEFTSREQLEKWLDSNSLQYLMAVRYPRDVTIGKPLSFSNPDDLKVLEILERNCFCYHPNNPSRVVTRFLKVI